MDDRALTAPAPRPALLHADEWAGALVGVAHFFRPPPRNTLHRLDVYQGLPTEVLFPAPRETPAVETRVRWRVPGMTSEDLGFASQHEPLEPNFRRHHESRRRRIHTATARRIVPAGGRDRPRLLYIHGYMQPETWVEEWALLTRMARTLEVEVIQLQPPYHGSRKPRRSRFHGELYWTADLVRSLESLRQSLLDARTLLRWLRAQAPTPVGICGISLGGALASALTCLEPDFEYSAPLIAHMDVGRLVADAPVLRAMRADLRRFGWEPDDVGGLMESIGWNALSPVIPTDRIHLFGAREDLFFRPELLEAMWRRWNRPRIAWYPCSHMGFIRHLPTMLGDLRTLVDEVAAA